MRLIGLLICSCFLLSFSSCGLVGSSEEPELRQRTEYYPVSRRQLPPEPVYSRLTWSHLPKPVVASKKEKRELLQPVIYFSFPKSNLAEALEAISQTIGYRLQYPAKSGKLPISLELTGTVEEALAEVARQAGVRASLDHESRVVKVVEGKEISPRLPPVKAN